MFQQTYYVDKRTGTFADVCAAYGLAVILDNILDRRLGTQTPHDVRIVDKGTAYVIELTFPLQEAWVDKCPFFAPVPFIRTDKNKDKTPNGIYEVDYSKERSRNEEYRKLLQTLDKTMDTDSGDQSEAEVALKEAEPHPDWAVWTKIITMSAIDTYTHAVTNWHANQNQLSV